MARQAVVLAMLLSTTLLAGFLAGCLGGDDDPKTGTDETPGTMEEGTGSIEGRVFTMDLEEVEGANVVLVEETDLVAEATTDPEGGYRITNIEPGRYRLQISAACCHQDARGVEVVEGETTKVDVQLEPFSSDDLKEYRMEEYEWTGFLACGYVLLIRAGDACSDVDEDSDRTHEFEVGEGLTTVTAALIWEAPGLLGEELQYGLARYPCTQGTGGACSTPGDYYNYNVGTSPLELRVDPDSNPDGPSLDDIGGEEPLDVQLRVFPPFSSDADLFYQVEFTVHYQLHYHQPAPEDFDPVPDM